jgi:hypothetical protein
MKNPRHQSGLAGWFRGGFTARAAVTLGLAWLLQSLAQSPAPAAAAPGSAEATPPIPPSPVEQFRSLLAMEADGRVLALANWPERSRETLRRKLGEYDAMAPGEAESRLRATELRHYLEPLLAASLAERTPALLAVPARLRPLVESRLKEWDNIPGRERRELLENEATLKYFSSARAPQSPAHAEIGMPPEIDPVLQSRLKRWREMTAADRSKASGRIQKFFELPAPERSRTLGMLSPGERAEMAAALDRFAQMPRDQRRVCIASFEKLAGMDSAERREFLRNAERWREMPPEERAQWRRLVHSLPPLPPIPAATPPLPPGAAR